MNYMRQMLSTQQVEAILLQKVRQKKAFALIRINDGENRALGLDIFYDRKKLPHWFRYTGVDKFDERVRRALVRSIKEADMVGLPTPAGFAFRPLSEMVLRHFHLRPKLICQGNINRFLLKRGILAKIVKSRRVLLLGLTMDKVKDVFQQMGARIIGVEPVNGFNDLPRLTRKLHSFPEFDIALIAAGIPGKPLCTHIRNVFGKVAIDIGHVPELLLYPNKSYGEIMKNWLKEHPSTNRQPHQHRPVRKEKHLPFLKTTPKKLSTAKSPDHIQTSHRPPAKRKSDRSLQKSRPTKNLASRWQPLMLIAPDIYTMPKVNWHEPTSFIIKTPEQFGGLFEPKC